MEDEAAQHFEGIRFGGDLEGEPAPRRNVIEQLPSADRALRHRDRISGAVAQPQLLAAGQRMILRHHRHQFLLKRHQRLETGEKLRPEHHDKVDLEGRERRHRPFMVDDFQFERHQRMMRAEFGDLPRQKIECQGLAAGDTHGAAPQALEVLDLRLHALDFAVLAAQIVDEDLAGGSETHAARPAIEQRRAEFLFQIGNPPIDRGRRDVEPFGGLSDRARTGDLVDIAENAEMLHRTAFSPVMPFRHHSSKKSAVEGNAHPH